LVARRGDIDDLVVQARSGVGHMIEAATRQLCDCHLVRASDTADARAEPARDQVPLSTETRSRARPRAENVNGLLITLRVTNSTATTTDEALHH